MMTDVQSLKKIPESYDKIGDVPNEYTIMVDQNIS